MGLETGTRIADLVPTNPVGATDFVSQGDDHIRLIKAAVQGSFPSLGATAVSLTGAQINDAALKSATQTIGGAWTFSLAPTMSGANLGAGTVPDAALSSNVPLKNAANAFTGNTQTIAPASGDAVLALTNATGPTTGFISAAPAALNIGTSTNHPMVFYANDLNRGNLSAGGNWTLSAPSSGTTLALSQASGGVSMSYTDSTVSGVLGWISGTSVYQGTTSNHGLITRTNNIDRHTITAAGNHTFAAPSSGTALTVNSAGASAQSWVLSGGPTASVQLGAGGGYFGTTTDHPTILYVNNVDRVFIDDGVQIGAPTGGDKGAGTLNTAGAHYVNEVRVESLPLINSTSTTLAKGQIHHITGNATLPALAAGEWVCIVNNSASPITITENSGDTTYWTTGAVSVSTLTVPARGRIIASGAGSNVVYVSGDIAGYA